MAAGLAPAFSVLRQCTMADSARPKTMTASTTAVHLKKSFTCSPPLKSYFKDVPALMSSRRLRVLSGLSPHASRGAGCLSSPLRRWSLCARLVLLSSSLLFVFVPVGIPSRHHHNSKSGAFRQSALPPFAFNVIYIIARFYCVVYTKRALYLPSIFVQVSQTLNPHKTFSRWTVVQILCTIVPITNFYLCSPCTIFRLRKKDCLYKITYLLLISQSLCLSTAYNTPPGVSCLLGIKQSFN